MANAQYMDSKVKIALQLPHSNKTDQYFSFRLRQDMSNEQSEFRQPAKIFVLSDIEGNFRTFYKLLIKARVIDKYLRWTFEDNHLVIIGDCFDRGEEVIECLWLIYSLEERAQREGGYVHFILGNHEIMNLNGDWRYVHPKYSARKSAAAVALYDGNNELWKWLCTKNIIEKIGNVLFVHGGIAPQLLKHNLSITEINNMARPWYANANELFRDSLLYTIFNSEHSPFWYRGYYNGIVTEETIDVTLTKFGVNTIVTGHTLVNQVSTYFDGKVINVDTDHANARSEGLLITKHSKRNHFYRIMMDKKRERIK